jgi:hypothetical protein
MPRRARPPEWLLFLAQLPASPSSARVGLWRRLRSAGAASVMQGAWVLPHNKAHHALFTKELALIRKSDGAAALFACTALAGTDNRTLTERFRADRGREYDEFAERSDGMLAEIAKETRARKFTFAELEEIEDDLAKLKAWLDKIATRDFFPDKRLVEARTRLNHCEKALQIFAKSVYRADGATRTQGGLSRD